MSDRDGPGAKALYQIRVQGTVGQRWSDWFGGIEIAHEWTDDGPPATLLTGVFGHSALHGVLDRLRDLNLTLISVTRLESGQEQGDD